METKTRILSFSNIQTRITCFRCTTINLLENKSNPIIINRPQQIRSTINTTIINNNQLKITITLIKNRINRQI